MTISERIKQRRLELGLSQLNLAKKVLVSRTAVSLWESGDSKGLKPENLVRCADALETTVRWLVFGKFRPLDVTRDLSPEAITIAVEFSRLNEKQQNAIKEIVGSYDTTKNAARMKAKAAKNEGEDNADRPLPTGNRTAGKSAKP